MRKTLISALLLLLSLSARAQFYLPGNDPGGLRWYSIESPHYRILFPEGADSLARGYARLFEQFREPVGRSIGFTPQGNKWSKKMPIVLHTHHVVSNGSVSFAPIRMDLYTTPEAYGSDPVSWPIQLAAHEPRHQAQLEKAESKGLIKVLSYLIGQGAAPVGWMLYMSPTRGEGDAVAVETGLASGTRARTADFLSYMRVAFDQGDWRNLTRWTNGSYKLYAPDYYKVGYVLMGGARYLYGDSMVVGEGLDLGLRKPWLFTPFNHNKAARRLSGKKANDSFRDIMEGFNEVWQADASARAPFQELAPVTPPESFPQNFTSPIWANGTLYALRDGYLHARELVQISSNGVERVSPFAASTSRIVYDKNSRRIYWSEVLPHPRWELAGSSIVRYRSLDGGGAKDLTSLTRYYNPQPSADGSLLAVTEYAVNGESALVILSSQDGSVVRRIPGPAGVQLTESAWQGEALYALGINQHGYGLYCWNGEWSEILAPSHQKVVNLEAGEGTLSWVSDRTGVNELYRYTLGDGRLEQLTSTRYGATDFCAAGDLLYCVSQTLDGKLVFSLPENALQPREVEFSALHAYTIEDSLTAQERALGPAPDLAQEVELSAPKRYSRLLHPLHLHSWAPFWVDVDNIMNSTFEFNYQTISPGISGFFQNTLGTLYGQMGAALHPGSEQDNGWRGALHAKLTYTGLYPVLEARFDLGDQNARQYTLTTYNIRGKESHSNSSTLKGQPAFSGSLRAYLPLSFRKGGLLYGFIPQLKYSFSNNVYSLGGVSYTLPVSSASLPAWFMLSGLDPANNVYMQRLNASARGYLMLPRAKSQIYPRWGMGLEGGIGFRPGMSQLFRPVAYGYAYAYLPGLWRTQGLKLTGIVQQQLGSAIFGDSSVSVMPRGFSSASSFLSSNYRTHWRVTADYAIPIYLGDLSVPALGYIRNFVLTPHADYLGLGKDFLWSAGADLVAHLGQLFFVSVDTTLGVSFSWLGGNVYQKTGQEKPYSVSLVFSMDI